MRFVVYFVEFLHSFRHNLLVNGNLILAPNFGQLKLNPVVTHLVAIAFFIVDFSLPPFSTNRLTAPSIDTTYIVEPIKANGDVDYCSWLNRRFAQNVTPANDAGQVLVKYVDRSKLNPVTRQMLGLNNCTAPPSFVAFLRKRGMSTDFPGSELTHSNAINCLRQVPFNSKEFPELDAWIKDSAEDFAAIRDAAKREKLLMTVVEQDQILCEDHELYATLRDLLTSLQILALAQLGEGEIAEALAVENDLLRLAKLLQQEGSLDRFRTGWRVGMHIEEFLAFLVTADGLSRAHLDSAKKLAAQTQGLSRLGDAQVEFSRVNMLNIVHSVARGDLLEKLASVMGGSYDGQKTIRKRTPNIGELIFRSTISWPWVLRFVNRDYDKVERICRLENNDERQIQFDKFQEQSNFYSDVLQYRGAHFYWEMTRKSRSRAFAGSLNSVIGTRTLMVWAEQLTMNPVRNKILTLAIAAREFQLRYDRFPESVLELAPEFLTNDELTKLEDLQITYAKKDKGFPEITSQKPETHFQIPPRVSTVEQWIRENISQR